MPTTDPLRIPTVDPPSNREGDHTVEFVGVVPTYGKPDQVDLGVIRTVARALWYGYGAAAFVVLGDKRYRWNPQKGTAGDVVEVPRDVR